MFQLDMNDQDIRMREDLRIVLHRALDKLSLEQPDEVLAWLALTLDLFSLSHGTKADRRRAA